MTNDTIILKKILFYVYGEIQSYIKQLKSIKQDNLK